MHEACFPLHLTQVIDKDVKQYWAPAQALKNTCSVTLVITDPAIATLWVHTSGQVRATACDAFPLQLMYLSGNSGLFKGFHK